MRRFLPTLAFLPVLLPVGLLAAFSGTGDRAVVVALLIPLAAFAAALQWYVGRSRLELSPDGVRLTGPGGSLAAAWSDVIAVRLDRGREGLVTSRSLDGRLADRLAKHRNVASYGAAWYDETQRALMAERRLIPLDAYSIRLRRGLLADVARFAPHLQADCAAGPVPAPPRPPVSHLVVAGAAAALALAAFWIWGITDDRVRPVVEPLTFGVLALPAAAGAVGFYRDRARFTAACCAALALLGAAMCAVGLARAFGGP